MRKDSQQGAGERKGAAGSTRGAQSASSSLAGLLAARRGADLAELVRFWAPEQPELAEGPARELLLEAITDPNRLERRVSEFDPRVGAVLDSLYAARGFELSWSDLTAKKALSSFTEYDIEAAVHLLQRRALVAQAQGNRFDTLGARTLALPPRVAAALAATRGSKEHGLFSALTLRGHLEAIYSDLERARRTSPGRLREMYKMYSADTAAVARVERLPDGVRELVEKAILEFGGILPLRLFKALDLSLEHWNGRRWAMILEQSLVGTVRDLDLTPYGIQHHDDTLVIFTEVALAWLRRVAVPGDPDRPHEELSLGIDVFTNIARFLAFLSEHDVRYTVKGEIFKTTEKKILAHLIPNPGRELSREEVLQFIYQYCKSRGLVEGTGERTLGVTSTGRTWASAPLQEKLEDLVEFTVEERIEGTEPFHQQRLRRLFLRMAKRVEPDTWYDLMYLPFLARNQYLASLEELGVEEVFAERVHTGRYSPIEDAQRMAWSLVRWARQRLYLAGVIDLGYDLNGRPVAARLTQHGARLLGLREDDAEPAGPRVGNLVVTPDFEVVLFKSGDDAELIHDLDRFGRRERFGETVHFRIEKATVRRALIEGLRLDRILATLEHHSRTPVPQNVLVSIRDWALELGRMELDGELVLACENNAVLNRLRQDPGVRGHIERELGPQRLQLSRRNTARRMRALLRDLGYVVELVGSIDPEA